jgi:tetratricopeptide (TPR) repeat protein
VLREIAFCAALLLSVGHALAGAGEDCAQDQDLERQITGCTNLIRENSREMGAYGAYANRGLAYLRKLDYARAIADYNKVIEIDPMNAPVYINRANAYLNKREYHLAIADYSRAIEINPKQTTAYLGRGIGYELQGEYDRAIANYNKAIEVDPSKYPQAYEHRGDAYYFKGESDRAIADYNRAIEVDPKYAAAYNKRGWVYFQKGDYDRTIAEATVALTLNPNFADALDTRSRAYLVKGDIVRALADATRAVTIKPSAIHYEGRGEVHEARGDRERAIEDYNMALASKPLVELGVTEKKFQTQAARRIAALRSAASTAPTVAVSTTAPAVATLPAFDRRVALVIGNSAYQNAVRLTNPANDARAIAASFRRLGFAEVIEKYDADLSGMTAVLKNFGDRSANAGWAVVYYSGHGLEMNGAAYLIPVDAKLERDTHVPDETVALSRVLEKVEGARKLRLVVLDACRNNPFVSRMVRSSGATRSIGRGLAAIEPEGGVLVAYSAKHGTTAEDGRGGNSPFAEAMLANLEQPGLEINFLFRRVRDQVLASTNGRQEPFLYGSLPSESLFFKIAAPR